MIQTTHKQEKQHRHVENFYFYYEEPGHIIGACPKKHVQHVAHTITFITTKGVGKKGNEDIQF
jgi:hypothetical protein